jgi:hypothetical protein
MYALKSSEARRRKTKTYTTTTVTTPAFDSEMKTALLTVTLPTGKMFVAETTFFN